MPFVLKHLSILKLCQVLQIISNFLFSSSDWNQFFLSKYQNIKREKWQKEYFPTLICGCLVSYASQDERLQNCAAVLVAINLNVTKW